MSRNPELKQQTGPTGDGDDMADEEVPTIELDPNSVLAANISQMVLALFAGGTVAETLVQVADLAVSTIEGCDFAGIFLEADDQVTAPVQTDPVVAEVDGLQRSSGEGPCLDALHQGDAFYAEDLADDPRWPNFGPAATALGVRSLLALPLRVNGVPGALNLYARYPLAFGVIDRGRGLLLAAMAGLAYSTALTHEEDEWREANLHAALATREIIGQAQGILMEREHLTSVQAFDILRRASQHLNRKLRDVAQNLVETGERPDTGPARG
jgi:GAF domain-containing protein